MLKGTTLCRTCLENGEDGDSLSGTVIDEIKEEPLHKPILTRVIPASQCFIASVALRFFLPPNRGIGRGASGTLHAGIWCPTALLRWGGAERDTAAPPAFEFAGAGVGWGQRRGQTTQTPGGLALVLRPPIPSTKTAQARPPRHPRHPKAEQRQAGQTARGQKLSAGQQKV